MGQTVVNKPLPKRYLKWLTVSLLLVLAAAILIWFGKIYSESRITGLRAPYLQMVGPHQVTFRWTTSEAGKGEVYMGTHASRLDSVTAETQTGRNHSIRVQGLMAATRYYYRVKQAGKWLSDKPEWFYTAPVPGSIYSSRILVLGDPGVANAVQSQVRDSALRWAQTNTRNDRPFLDLVLTTGDNAYPNGTNEQFIRHFFTPYQQLFANIPVWPLYGNHDARRWTFYKQFDRPQQGELGGVASHSHRYFSFDYAQVHFVMLDSHDSKLNDSDPMLTWLQQDLAQTKQPWKIVLFHHPPYTRGTHNSDNPQDSRGRMVRVRERLLPVLEAANVDLVFSGHSHVYERSHLIHGHYGFSQEFSEKHIIDKGRAEQDGSVLYSKQPVSGRMPNATMYLVVGASRWGNRGPFDHPAMPVHSDQAGAMILDVDSRQLAARYITDKGVVEDYFIIQK